MIYFVSTFRPSSHFLTRSVTPLNQRMKRPQMLHKKDVLKIEPDINSDLNCVFPNTLNQTKTMSFQPTQKARDHPKPLISDGLKLTSRSPSKRIYSRNKDRSKFSSKRQSTRNNIYIKFPILTK
jgi:hypothetical protein